MRIVGCTALLLFVCGLAEAVPQPPVSTNNGVATLVLTPSRVTGGTTHVRAVVGLPGDVPALASVTFAVGSSDPKIVRMPTTVTIPSARRGVEFVIETQPVPADTDVQITLTPVAADAAKHVEHARLTVLAAVPTDLLVEPEAVFAPAVVKISVVLSGPAPASGVTVPLTVQPPGTVLPVKVAAGATAGGFQQSFAGDSSSYVPPMVFSMSTSRGIVMKRLAVGVKILAITFDPQSFLFGQPITGKITLSGAAPPDGAKIEFHLDLYNCSPGCCVPINPFIVTVAPNASETAFASPAMPQTIGTYWFTAIWGQQRWKVPPTIAIRPPLPKSIDAPAQIQGGHSAVGKIALNGPAASGSCAPPIALASNNAAVQVPSLVTVPPGAVDASFDIKTAKVSENMTAIITAAGASKTIVITPPGAQ